MIFIKEATVHNLKNISVEIPEEKIVIVTGVSGSGKSSFVFDTVYTESQRRFLEVLNLYSKYMIGGFLEKPAVQAIEGISPSIALKQVKSSTLTFRSTVGTISEIYDYLRLLYTHCSDFYCPQCQVKMISYSDDSIYNFLVENFMWKKIKILVPVVTERKGEYRDLLEQGLKTGFMRVVIDGKEFLLSEALKVKIDKNKLHNIDFVIDRINLTPAKEKRLKDAINLGAKFNSYLLKVESEGKLFIFNKKTSCPKCHQGFIDVVPRLFSFNSDYGKCLNCEGRGKLEGGEICRECQGERLNKWARNVKLKDKNIYQLSSLSIEELEKFLLSLSGLRNHQISQKIIPILLNKLRIFKKLGLGYLELVREASCISGGELQRLFLGRLIANNLSGVLYIFDEPSIGLHPWDCKKLIDFFKLLKDRGNTVILVEHEKEIIKNGDYFLDFGPYAGEKGGKIVFAGSREEFLRNSFTGKYLRKKIRYDLSRVDNNLKEGFWLKGAKKNNLKKIDVYFPLNSLSIITGVSGAGKTSLIEELQENFLLQSLGIDYRKISFIRRIDQKLQQRSSRSVVATFLSFFNKIRKIYSNLEVAKIRGLKEIDFSFNSPKSRGRCEVCKGTGMEKLEMNFLPDYSFICRSCGGKRYNNFVEEIKYKGKSIGDILELTVEGAIEFFQEYPVLVNELQKLLDFGLGYLKLGQSMSTLSGGEIQRLKIISQLKNSNNGKNGIYLLEEPTIGLHFKDVEILISLLLKLKTQGNTVIVIDNTEELFLKADWIIELGPKGGKEGGYLLFQGNIQEWQKKSFYKNKKNA